MIDDALLEATTETSDSEKSEKKGRSVRDRKRAAAELGVDLDPRDPTRRMSIATTDFETGEKKTHTPEEALAAYDAARKIKAKYGKRARKRLAGAKKEYEAVIASDSSSKDYKTNVDKAARRLQSAKGDMEVAQSIPKPRLVDFKPRQKTGAKVAGLIRRAAYTGAAALGTQILGKLGDRAVKDFGVGVPGGGDAQAQERARQGAENFGSFVKQAIFGDREAKEKDTDLKKFGLFGNIALKASEGLRPTSARQRRLNILAGKSRKRDIFTAARQRLGRTPFSNREAELLGAFGKK